MTPLDHNDVKQALDFRGWLLLALTVCCFALISLIAVPSFSKIYDASHHKAENESAGFDTIRVYDLTESWVWKDRQHASVHIKDNDMPDGLDQMFAKLQPGQPVMVDIESLPVGIYGCPDRETRTVRLQYLAEVMQSIRQQTKEAGFDPLFLWYGGMVTGENPNHKLKESRLAMLDWFDTETKLHHQFDAILVPCYHRYDAEGDEERAIQRVGLQRTISGIIGKQTWAIVMPNYHNYHSIKNLRNQPVDSRLMLSHLEAVKQQFDGVVFWQGPNGGEGLRANRFLTLAMLNQE